MISPSSPRTKRVTPDCVINVGCAMRWYMCDYVMQVPFSVVWPLWSEHAIRSQAHVFAPKWQFGLSSHPPQLNPHESMHSWNHGCMSRCVDRQRKIEIDAVDRDTLVEKYRDTIEPGAWNCVNAFKTQPMFAIREKYMMESTSYECLLHGWRPPPPLDWACECVCAFLVWRCHPLPPLPIATAKWPKRTHSSNLWNLAKWPKQALCPLRLPSAQKHDRVQNGIIRVYYGYDMFFCMHLFFCQASKHPFCWQASRHPFFWQASRHPFVSRHPGISFCCMHPGLALSRLGGLGIDSPRSKISSALRIRLPRFANICKHNPQHIMHIFQQHTMCSLGPLGSCNGQRAEGGMSTPGMHKHIQMLSQGVVVATIHTANTHNLSFHDSIMYSSLIASVIVSYMHLHNYKPQGLDTFSMFHDNTCVLGGGTLNHT